MLYAITDIESTGGTKGTDKITEIAIYLFDGDKIVKEFHTLVNPQRAIQPFVVKLTGITDDMVRNSPTFTEITKDILDITDKATFVAHNVSFDYNFLRAEFQSLGIDFTRNKLCTVNLSRKILPGHESYSLGKLTEDLGIGLHGRHRADGDALATVKLFKILLENDESSLIEPNKNFISQKHNIPIEVLGGLPLEGGLYYFYDKNGDIIYVGKSKNIHDKVFSHLANITTKKAIALAEETVNVTYELTGNSFISEIFELCKIREHQPKYNLAQRRTTEKFGLFSTMTPEDYYELRVMSIDDQSPLIGFSTEKQADKYLNTLVHKFELCNCLTGRSSKGRSCLHHQLNLCKGAGVKEETIKSYNDRVLKVISSISFDIPNFMIVCQGRTQNEKGVVLIKGGVFKGLGYVTPEVDIDNYPNHIIKFHDSLDIRKVIEAHLKKDINFQLIELL